MSSDRDTLLAVIRNHPDEDTPRLVYCDWIDENSADPIEKLHSPFIRLQIAISDAENDKKPELLEQEWQLLRNNPELIQYLHKKYSATLNGLDAAERVTLLPREHCTLGVDNEKVYLSALDFFSSYNLLHKDRPENELKPLLLEIVHSAFDRGFCDRTIIPMQRNQPRVKERIDALNASPEPITTLIIAIPAPGIENDQFPLTPFPHPWLKNLDTERHAIKRAEIVVPSDIMLSSDGITFTMNKVLQLNTLREIELRGSSFNCLSSEIANAINNASIPNTLQHIDLLNVNSVRNRDDARFTERSPWRNTFSMLGGFFSSRNVAQDAPLTALLAPNSKLTNVVLTLGKDGNPAQMAGAYEHVSRQLLVDLDQHNLHAAQHHNIEYHTPDWLKTLINDKRAGAEKHTIKAYEGVKTGHARVARFNGEGIGR